MDKTNECVEYINSHTAEIIASVNDYVKGCKDWIREYLIQDIKDILTPIPVHYEQIYDDNLYDYSRLVKQGNISLNQSIKDFLHEYNGDKQTIYLTYADEVCDDCLELASDMMMSVIRDCLESQFNIKLSDEEFEGIKNGCYDFYQIYDNCIAGDDFFWFEVVDWVGIGDLLLSTIVPIDTPLDS
jgi:hypothetical protein